MLTNEDVKEDKSTATYAGAIVIGCILALVAIRTGMVKVK